MMWFRLNSMTYNRANVMMTMMNGSLTDVSEMTAWNRTIVVAKICVIKIAIVSDAVDRDYDYIIHIVIIFSFNSDCFGHCAGSDARCQTHH